MDGIGLVLAGGGGKGAYQIGVWKYLREAGLDGYVRAVSGTSVGALNAALFAAGNLENAERIWRNIRPELILTPRNYSPEEVSKWLAEAEISAAPKEAAALPALPSDETLAPALAEDIGHTSPFSREGLLSIMREGVDFDAIRAAPLPCYATCLAVRGWKRRRFDLRRYPAADAQRILLASSAIPVVFDTVDFNGEALCDGGVPGVGDNVPVEPVFQENVKYIIVVNLTQDALLDHSAFPGSKLIEITPRADLGSFLSGTLDFTPEGAARRIDLGYEDTKNVLGGFVEAALIHRQNELIFEAFEASERKYQDRVKMMNAQRAEMQSQRDRDDYDVLWEEFSGPGEAEEAPEASGDGGEDTEKGT